MKQQVPLLKKTVQNNDTFRSAPFWAWNGDLQEAELRRQVRVFKEMGCGGFFIHSRDGLATPYMGKKWFDCVAAVMDEAVKNGL